MTVTAVPRLVSPRSGCLPAIPSSYELILFCLVSRGGLLGLGTYCGSLVDELSHAWSMEIFIRPVIHVLARHGITISSRRIGYAA